MVKLQVTKSFPNFIHLTSFYKVCESFIYINYKNEESNTIQIKKKMYQMLNWLVLKHDL